MVRVPMPVVLVSNKRGRVVKVSVFVVRQVTGLGLERHLGLVCDRVRAAEVTRPRSYGRQLCAEGALVRSG